MCECPKCHMLGLHLMPFVATFTEEKPGVRVTIEELPRVLWYDGRPDDLSVKQAVRTHHEYTLVSVEIDRIVRECVFCSHSWYQELRRRTL